jgi:alpha-tubulin suppressor-like RCC1 family protein
MRRRAAVQLLFATVAFAACTESTEPEPLIETTRRLSVGSATVCALDAEGQARCWGSNRAFYEYGAAPATVLESTSPVVVPVPRLASLNGGGSQHMCGLTADREIICWGRGGFGQLARGAVEPFANLPAQIAMPASWKDVVVARISTCALTTDGTAYCWGFDQRGGLGDPAIAPGSRVTTPNLVTGGLKFSSIVPGWQHTCGIVTSGAAYCWGSNTDGQLGIGIADELTNATPRLVSGSLQFKKLSLSARSSCGITTGNQLYCWGYNGTGQLGDGSTISRTVPTLAASSAHFIDVSLGDGFPTGTVGDLVPIPTGLAQGGVAHGCALADDQTAWCWGWNGAGQVGDGTISSRLTPVQVAGGNKFTSVAAGAAYTCATGETGLSCWGSNAIGQLGNGSRTDSPIPVSVNISWP